MRKLLLLFIAALGFAINSFANIASGKSGTGTNVIDWVISDDGTLTITKATTDKNGVAITASGDMPGYNDNSTLAPWYDYRSQINKIVISDDIVKIGAYSFYRCTQVTEVKFPTFSLKNIDGNAFRNCSNLKQTSENNKLVIPESVTAIGAGAFRECTSLTSFTFPSKIKTINNTVLYNCTSITSITIPDDVTKINSQAFEGTKITGITLPSKLTTLGDWAFQSCTKINTTVVIPKSVTSIGKNPFYNATGLVEVEAGNENYVTIDNVLFDKDVTTLITYPRDKKNASYTVPSTVKVIGERAFYNVTALTSLTLPDDLEKINARAFYKMSNLTALVIPAKVTTLGGGFITDCAKITDLRVDEGNQNFKIVDDVIFSSDMKTLYTYPMSKTDEEYNIPDGVTSLSAYAFSYSKVKKVNCPVSLSSIGASCFMYSSLTSIDLPESATAFGSEVFYHCSNLTHVTLSSQMTVLPYRTFRDCVNLEDITLPDKITRFGSQSSNSNYDGEQFQGCTKLKSIKLPTMLSRVSYRTFQGCTALEKIEIPYSVTVIGHNAFNGCTALDSVEMGPQVARIDYQAFINCSGLTKVRINRSTPPKVAGDTFSGIHKTDGVYDAKLIIPCGSEAKYLNYKSDDTGENVYARTFDVSNAIPTVFYTLTVDTSDPEAGSVAIIRKAACGVIPGIQATANPGYHFTGWHDTEINENPYYFPLNDNMSFIADFEQIDYYLYYVNDEGETSMVDPGTLKIPCENGSVIVEKNHYNYNEDVELTIEAALGYKLKTLSVKTLLTDEEITVNNNIFTMPDGDVVVEAEFEYIDYEINIGEAENGSASTTVSGVPANTAHYGDKVTIIASPVDKYKLANVTVSYGDGKTASVSEVPGEPNQKTFFMPADNVNITLSFEKIDYTVPVLGTFIDGNFKYTVTALNPKKVVSVAAKDIEVTGTLEIQPTVTYLDVTYEVVSISNNGFMNEDITLVIDRTEPMPLGNNSIIGSIPLFVPCGYKQAYIDAGYPNTTIESIAPYEYSVSVSAGANGTAKVNRQPDCDNHSAEIEATPAEGYAFDKWDDDATATAKRTIADVTDNLSFKASFKAIDYTVSKLATEHGSFNLSANTANIGQTISITDIEPAEGYELDKIEVQCENGAAVDVNTGATPTFTMPAKNVSVSVTFKATQYLVSVSNPENGIIKTDKQSHAFGETVVLSVVPNTGYKLKDLVVKNSTTNATISYSADYTFTMPASDVNVVASFEKQTYSITTVVTGDKVENVTVGTVSVQDNALYDSEVAITVSLLDNHYIATVHSLDVAISDGHFVMPAKDVTISVTFTYGKDFLLYEEFTLGDFVFTVTDVDNHKVSVRQSHQLSGDVVIPTVVPLKNTDFEVTSVEAGGFLSSTDITSVTIRSDVAPELGADAFASLPLLQVPCSASASYNDAGYNTYFAEIAEHYEGYTIEVRSADENMGTVEIVRQPGCSTNPIVMAIPNTGYSFVQWSDESQEINYQINEFDNDMLLIASFEQKTYLITKAQYEHGTVTVKETAVYNEEITVETSPDEGYKLSSIHVAEAHNGNEVAVVDSKFRVPDDDVEVSVQFVPIDYTITVESAENGEVVTPTDGTIAHKGDRVSVSAIASTGYKQKSLVVKDADGVELEIQNGKFTMPAKNVTITAEFEAIDYKITVNSTGSGSAIASAEKAHYKDVVTIDLTPEDGFELAYITIRTISGTDVEYAEVSAGSQYSFAMPAEGVTVSVEFGAIVYNVVATESIIGGELTISRNKATKGDIVEVTTVANKGYQYKNNSLTITGDDLTDYTALFADGQFAMPAANVTVNAEFEQIDYKLTITPAQNGSVTPTVTDVNKLHYGEVVTFNVSSDDNFELKSITALTSNDNNVELNKIGDNSYSFTMPDDDVTITAVFDDVKYEIVISDMSNGTVVPSEYKAKEGSTITLTVNAANGYVLAKLMVATESEPEVNLLDDGEKSFVMPAEKVIVTAEFEENKQPTSVSEYDATADIKAYGVNRAIVIEVGKPTDIVVVDITGRTILSPQSVEGHLSIPANRGIYFVRYQGGVKEVIVR